jgi:hypothetical protein
MASLTKDTPLTPEAVGTLAFKIVNGTTCYAGSFIAKDPSTGRATPYTGAGGQIVFGPQMGSGFSGSDFPNAAGGVTGDTAANPEPELSTELGGGILYNVAVTGLTALTKIGLTVYLNNDDHTFTLTRPTKGLAVGTVVGYWGSSGFGDILLYSHAERIVSGYAGNGGAAAFYIATNLSWPGCSNVAQRRIVAPFHAKIMSVTYQCAINTSGASGTTTISPQINNVALTSNGGQVTLGNTITIGTVTNGTAVTDDGTNEFHEGDEIELVGSATSGTLTTGAFEVMAKVLMLPGA